jgi:16S rRNA (cytosine967-C5)-methyltransferase
MQNNLEKIPLWRQLQATAAVLASVWDGLSGTVAIDAVASNLRPGVQALAFHVWRNLGRAQALRKLLANKAPPVQVDALLCTALALAWNASNVSYDAFTLVNQAVEAAKRNPHMRAQANFVNACLRRFLRERETLVSLTNSDLVAVWNHPRWWILRLQTEYPTCWEEMLSAANTQAPLTLRVNARRSTPSVYLGLLQTVGIEAKTNGPYGVDLTQAVAVQRLPGFSDGMVSVQDGAAQMAAPLLLQGLAGLKVPRLLDACAAPGGKTGHLLELSDARIVALDIDAKRCLRISDNLLRIQVDAEVLAADASYPEHWWDGKLFDGILLDAPCTASGIVRRHPDVRWLRRETDVAQLALLQAKILRALWPLLRPGGVLLFCTCSIFHAEGQDQVETFLAHNTDATLLPSPGHLAPQNGAKSEDVQDNQVRDHDGFFYALLQKRMG